MEDKTLEVHISHLANLLNPDDSIRGLSEEYINNLKSQNPAELLRLCCLTILSDDSLPPGAVENSYILVKQISLYLNNNYMGFGSEQKQIIRAAMKRGLLSPNATVQNLSSYCYYVVFKAGKDDLKSEVFPDLCEPICNPAFAPCCTIGSFLALKELVSHNLINEQTPYFSKAGQTILNAFEQIMRNPTIFSQNDFITFVNCYSEVLTCFNSCYPNEESRMHFLSILYDTFAFNLQIHKSLYNLLFSFVKCYYSQIAPYMEQIIQITTNSLEMIDNIEVIYPAIEFWSNLAKLEIRIVEKNRNTGSNYPYINIIEQQAPALLSVLLQVIMMHTPESLDQSSEEEMEQNMYNPDSVCKLAMKCIRRFSALTQYVEQKLISDYDECLNSPDWRIKLVAVLTFSLISKSCQYSPEITKSSQVLISPVVMQFFENHYTDLITIVSDPNEILNHGALSTLAVVFQSNLSYQLDPLNNIYMVCNMIDATLRKAPGESIAMFTIERIHRAICDIFYVISKMNYTSHSNSEKFQQLQFDEEQMKVPYRISGSDNPLSPYSVFYFEFLRQLFTMFLDPMVNTYDFQETCTNTILETISSIPSEQIDFLLQNYFPYIFQFIIEQFAFVQNPLTIQPGMIDPVLRIQEGLSMLSRIIRIPGSKISEYLESVPLIKQLIDFLTIKNSALHEESLYTMNELIIALKKDMIPLIPELLNIFLISQESGNTIIIERSARMMDLIFQNMEIRDQIQMADIKKIFDILLAQAKDLNLMVSTRLVVFKTIGHMINAIKIAAEPFLELYRGLIIDYQNIPDVNPLLDQENASVLFSSIIDNFQYLYNASNGTQYKPAFYQELRKNILKYLPHISQFDECFNNSVKLSILNFLKSLFDGSSRKEDMIDSRISMMLHQNSFINKLLRNLSNDDNYKIVSAANEIIYEYIDGSK